MHHLYFWNSANNPQVLIFIIHTNFPYHLFLPSVIGKDHLLTGQVLINGDGSIITSS